MNSDCVCGKKRSNLNQTNWTRHVNACKKKKSCSTAHSISTYFKTVSSSTTTSMTAISSSGN